MKSHQRISLLASLCILWLCAACENPLEPESEVEVGNILIQFKVAVQAQKSSTRMANQTFAPNDCMGVFAVLSEADNLAGQRYINNVRLKVESDGSVTTEKKVYYPAGDEKLNFVSYYPYVTTGIAAGSSAMPIYISPKQNEEQEFSNSQFLVATANKVANGTETVTLKYKPMLAHVKLKIMPDENRTAQQVLQANPQIKAIGFHTQADFDFQEMTSKNYRKPQDIVPHGTWKISGDGKCLEGAELVLLPHENSDEGRCLLVGLNEKEYICELPDDLDLEKGYSYELAIALAPEEQHQLTGWICSIEPWEIGGSFSTTMQNNPTMIPIDILSFEQSMVYRVYRKGTPVAEIVQEYLTAPVLSKAITAYPLTGGKTDLQKGIIVKLLDSHTDLTGASLAWNTDNHTFQTGAADAEATQTLYYDETNGLTAKRPANPLPIYIEPYTINDWRSGTVVKYPIAKVGTQYWMQSDLKATHLNNGISLERRTQIGGQGYMKDDATQSCFYTGEAVKTGILAPTGWKVPSVADWELLQTYVGGDAGKVKANCPWSSTQPEETVVETTNKTGLNIVPTGGWNEKNIDFVNQAAGFWACANNSADKLSAYWFKGENNDFGLYTATWYNPKECYKAYAVRCIRE